MLKRIRDLAVSVYFDPLAPWIFFVLAMGLAIAFGPTPSRSRQYPTSEDLVYIRDDQNRSCFAFLRGNPSGLTSVDCDRVRWP